MELISKEAQQLAEEANKMVTKWQDFKIVTQPEYISSTDILKQIKSKATELDTLRKSMTKPLDESKSKIMDFFRPVQDKLAKAEQIIKSAILVFQTEQEKIRRELQAKIEAEKQKELQAAQDKLDKAQAEGKIKQIDKLQNKIETMQNTVTEVKSNVPDIKGVTKKKIWKYRVKDINAIPRNYLMPNDKMLSQLATATKGTLQVTGIEFYYEEIISSSGR